MLESSRSIFESPCIVHTHSILAVARRSLLDWPIIHYTVAETRAQVIGGRTYPPPMTRRLQTAYCAAILCQVELETTEVCT
jgi:hypothetical protein